MPGTTSGGMRAAETNRKKYGKNFYAMIGAIGGKAGNTGGFASNPELASKAGRKGGLISRRGPSLKTAQRVKHAKEMRDNGATLKEISLELGVAVSTVSNYLKEN